MEWRIAEQRTAIAQLTKQVEAYKFFISGGWGCPGVYATAMRAFQQVLAHACACQQTGVPTHTATAASFAAKDGLLSWHRATNRKRHAVGLVVIQEGAQDTIKDIAKAESVAEETEKQAGNGNDEIGVDEIAKNEETGEVSKEQVGNGNDEIVADEIAKNEETGEVSKEQAAMAMRSSLPMRLPSTRRPARSRRRVVLARIAASSMAAILNVSCGS